MLSLAKINAVFRVSLRITVNPILFLKKLLDWVRVSFGFCSGFVRVLFGVRCYFPRFYAGWVGKIPNKSRTNTLKSPFLSVKTSQNQSKAVKSGQNQSQQGNNILFFERLQLLKQMTPNNKKTG